MLRGMVYVDHLNFNIALQNYYRFLDMPLPKLDYNLLFQSLISKVSNVDLLKSYLFVPKPDDFLMNGYHLRNYYNWIVGLNNYPFIEVVEGNYYARPANENIPMDIYNKSSYYKIEKGTDINLAISALNNAFYNAYDVAFFMTADTDYIELYKSLRHFGKLVIVAVVKGQNTSKLKSHVDNIMYLDNNFFSQNIRKFD